MKAKIYTMTHKKFLEPQDSIYVPLHVGRAEAEDLGYQGDDEGDSISGWNKYYGELTGVYWVWKNEKEADIIGICHYRRYFMNKQRQLLNEREYEEILKDYDIIVSNKAYADTNYLDYYAEAHNVQDLLTVGEVMKEKYPDYAPYFDAAMKGDVYYYGNLMVTSRELFQSYAAWLFDILFEVQKRIDVESYDLYNRRVFGFLSEQMIKIWADKNHLKVYEGIVGITSEKAETVEFKLAMSQLVRLGQIDEARQMFNEYMELRPDIGLELSDIRGEIPIIEQLLYIAQEERGREVAGLMDFSDDLNAWIAHYRKVLECMARFSKGEKKQEDIDYIRQTRASWVMGEVMLMNVKPGIIEDPEQAVKPLYETSQPAVRTGADGNAEGKRLIFFAGVYDTLDLFTYQLRQEFEAMGYETMVFDVRDTKKSLQELSAFTAKPVKAAITFNNLGFNMELRAGQNIWEELGIFCINILMDHPCCYKNALDHAPANAIVLCTDRNHMRYLERFYPQIPMIGYLPHAGKELSEVKRPLAERGTDVLYAGNLSSSFADNIIPDLSKYREFDARALCKRAYEDLIAHPAKTTEQALEEALQEQGLALSDEALKDIIADLHFVDLYAVSYYREKAVQAIAEQGIQIQIYGAGWENCAWIDRPNVSYGGKIPAEEVIEKMQDAKVVLSTMTWFKDGTHDRVFNGMMQGAVAVTDTSGYMKEEFCGYLDEVHPGEDNRELVFFELEEIGKLPAQVQELLDNPQKAQQIADRGYAKAKKSHTWRTRAQELAQDLLSQL